MPVAVGHDLELDVMRVHDQLLDVNLGVAESLLRLHARAVETLHQAHLVMRRAHPAAAAAGDRLDHHRIADFLRDLDRFRLGLDDAVAPWRDRHAGFARTGARGILVAHRAHRSRRRADELDLAALADLREVRVLGEKSVAGMDRIHVADFRRAHDAVDLQITIGARRRADADRFVGQLDVQRIDIRLGINRQRPDAEFLAGADDAQGDFAAVCDQDFLEHCLTRIRPSCEIVCAKTNQDSLRRSFAPLRMTAKSGLTNFEEGLAELDRLAVFRHHLGDHAPHLGLDFVHHFHRLDDANDGVLVDFLADLGERRRLRRRGAIECADHRRGDFLSKPLRLAPQPVRLVPLAAPELVGAGRFGPARR